MDDVRLLIDLHRPNPRLGPGSEATTRQALALSGLLGRPGLEVADLGCGTGASALVLAEALDARITAVDLFPELLDELRHRAEARGLGARITTLAASFDALPFAPGSLDAIWSEGAIYNLGFEAGLAAWRPLLRPGGVLAVSELTWLTETRPAELQAHWDREYPEVAPAASKLAALERQGFGVLGWFPLPPDCWLEHYYRPLQARFPALLEQHAHSEAARACVAAEAHEIDLYTRHQAFVSYGFYVARRA
jgi:ubiquinone/menaquinone biosynthesis C-methylase UbiE